jgi:PKD repeat protein
MMHKWRASLFTFLLIGAMGLVFLVTNTTYAACPEGMTSYWKLDESTPTDPGGTYEDSFNNNDGTGNVNPTATTDGVVNGAQEFDGTMGIDVPADSSFGWYQNESFSIEYWVKRADSPALSINEVAVGREDSSSAQVRWWTGLTTTQQAGFFLRDYNGVAFEVTGTKPVVDGAWHHVVAVRDADNDELRLYVDGQEDATPVSATYVSGFESRGADLNIGWLNLTPFYHFKGALDEVALYNRALTLAEIQDHYNNGVGKDYCPGGTGPFPKELTSYWKLDESTPTDLGGTYEDSFNNNDGTGNANPTATTDGVVNGAQEFDGAMGIDVSADSSFGWYQNESFSIEYWVKRADSPALSINEVAVGREDSASPQVLWWTGLTTTQLVQFFLRDNAGVEFEVTGAKNVVDGAWHHVVAVRDADNDELRLYVDGEDPTIVSATYGAGFISTADLTIGWLNVTPFYRFKGALDEVALYSRALTEPEIQQHYDDGLEGWGIGNIPVAGFTASPITGVRPLLVNFTDESTGNITSWSWDFGDGLGTSTVQNTTYTYTNAGTYTVSLTVTGPYGTDAETKTDYIVVGDTAPVANFTADPVSGTYPLEVDFTDQSIENITSWSWDFGDGLGTSTVQNPTYIYNNAGTYTVSLTVISSGGSDTETKTDYITVEKKKSGGGGGGCFIATAAK